MLSCKHSGERFKAVPRFDDLRSLLNLKKMLACSVMGVSFEASSERFKLHTLEEEKKSKQFKKKAWTSVLKFKSFEIIRRGKELFQWNPQTLLVMN